MKLRIQTTSILAVAILLAALLLLAGCGGNSADPADILSGDPLFFDVRWGDDAETIIKKAGEPDESDEHFFTYNNQELFGYPCMVVLVVDFSYSFPGLFSVTHTFTGTPGFEVIYEGLTERFGEPMQRDIGNISATWVFEATTIVFSDNRISFTDTHA